MKPYILTFRPEHPILYGPFESEKEAEEWGLRWQFDNLDDLHWQLVLLATDLITAEPPTAWE